VYGTNISSGNCFIKLAPPLETLVGEEHSSAPSFDVNSEHLIDVQKPVPVTLSSDKGGELQVSFKNYFFPTKSSRVRRKAWKPNKRARRMVLGSDVGLEESCRLALCGLVGRLSYSHITNSSVQGWITQFWAPLLGYESEMLCLTKGWFGFICKTPEYAELLLNSLWVIWRSTLMLKRWRVAFDLRSEYFHYRHLWSFYRVCPYTCGMKVL